MVIKFIMIIKDGVIGPLEARDWIYCDCVYYV